MISRLYQDAYNHCLRKHKGLKRCGKSCRLRWRNYLRPGIKRGNISSDEEELIIRLHNLLGNRLLTFAFPKIHNILFLVFLKLAGVTQMGVDSWEASRANRQ